MVIILNFKSNYLAASMKKERVVMKTQSCSTAFQFLMVFLRNHTSFFDNECDANIKETCIDYLCPII